MFLEGCLIVLSQIPHHDLALTILWCAISSDQDFSTGFNSQTKLSIGLRGVQGDLAATAITFGHSLFEELARGSDESHDEIGDMFPLAPGKEAPSIQLTVKQIKHLVPGTWNAPFDHDDGNNPQGGSRLCS